MIRLDQALSDVIKPAVANESNFKSESERLLQQANIVSAIGKVISLPGMDEADDDGYVEFSRAMQAAAKQLANAVKDSDYELASKSFTLIDQACNDCHADWR